MRTWPQLCRLLFLSFSWTGRPPPHSVPSAMKLLPPSRSLGPGVSRLSHPSHNPALLIQLGWQPTLPETSHHPFPCEQIATRRPGNQATEMTHASSPVPSPAPAPPIILRPCPTAVSQPGMPPLPPHQPSPSPHQPPRPASRPSVEPPILPGQEILSPSVSKLISFLGLRS